MGRRLEKRIYIPLPDVKAREELFTIHTRSLLLDDTVDHKVLAEKTDGYSGADIHIICRDAAMMPLRRIISDKSPQEILELKSQGKLDATKLPLVLDDFTSVLTNIHPSVSKDELQRYEDWFKEFGSN